jgi:DNA repair ATPase RecN
MILVLLPLLLLTGACAHAPARDPAVAQDLLEYVDKIKKWEPVEAQVLRAIRDVRRSQYVDDDYVIATLSEVMDDVELHREEIRRYQPRTQLVIGVHKRYRTAWKDLQDSFATIIAAMQQKDYMRLSHGTDAMARSRGELITVAAELSRLLEETGLERAPGKAAAS